MTVIALRPLIGDDMDALFEMMRDPKSVRMAAFTAEDPSDRARFDAHQARIRADPTTTNRAIIRDGVLVGSIASFVMEGDTEITYWIDRSAWAWVQSLYAGLFVFSSIGSRTLTFWMSACVPAGWLILKVSGGYPLNLVVPRSPTLIDTVGANGTVSQPVVVNVYGGPVIVVGSSYPTAVPVELCALHEVGLRTYLLTEPFRMNDSP